MLTIREIGADELYKIRDLAEEIWPISFKEILKPDQIRYMLNWMYDPEMLGKQLNEGHRFFLAEVNGSAIGFMGVEMFHADPLSLKLHKLYVLPQLQGRGIGKCLVDKAAELARTTNVDRIVLNVNRFNQAVSFYHHIGFKVLYEENIDIGSGYWMEDYVMALDINSSQKAT